MNRAARRTALSLLALAALALAAVNCGAPAPGGAPGAGAHSPGAAGAQGGAGGAGAAGAAAAAGATDAAGGAGGAGASGASGGTPAPSAEARAASAAAWDLIYGVLQHPRCANCHPAGNAPLQGDAMVVHSQSVQRGPGGHGLFGMRCATCHQATNLESPHLPPGVPNWHMPRPDMPLVFVGVGKRALSEQLRDPARNGGKTLEQLYEHVASDPLVLWGWNPGPGRAPVSTPHADVVAAMRTWIDGGCASSDG